MQTAFQAAKDALRSATGLAFPRPQAELALMADASAEHVGVALQQRTSLAAPWEPLGFFSRKLDAAQVRYSAYDNGRFKNFPFKVVYPDISTTIFFHK